MRILHGLVIGGLGLILCLSTLFIGVPGVISEYELEMNDDLPNLIKFTLGEAYDLLPPFWQITLLGGISLLVGGPGFFWFIEPLRIRRSKRRVVYPIRGRFTSGKAAHYQPIKEDPKDTHIPPMNTLIHSKKANIQPVLQPTQTTQTSNLKLSKITEPFFCQVCEASRPATSRRMKCETCSRYVCLDCFTQMANVGKPDCPMCGGRLYSQ